MPHTQPQHRYLETPVHYLRLGHLACSLIFGLALSGCASGPRARVIGALEEGQVSIALQQYDALRGHEGADPRLLAAIAAHLLEARSADSGEVGAAAVAQLSLAGTAGQPALRRLSEVSGPADGTGLSDTSGQGRARRLSLVALCRREEERACLVLRAQADSPAPEVLAAAIESMDPERDLDWLLGHLNTIDPLLRAALVRIIGGGRVGPEALSALARIARVDPETSVRAAAVRALGHSGPRAFEILRERLGDPSASVRLSAVLALWRADPSRAQGPLSSLLAAATSPAGIEAARILVLSSAGGRSDSTGGRSDATGGQSEGAQVAAGYAYLGHALSSPDANHRAQAAVAIASLPSTPDSSGPGSSAPLMQLMDALSREGEQQVRLALGRALHGLHQSQGTEALLALLEGDDGMVSLQAASILAPDHDDRALRYLSDLLNSEAPSNLRRRAARALARDALRPDSVRRALSDSDLLVRVYAAGGILAAANHF